MFNRYINTGGKTFVFRVAISYHKSYRVRCRVLPLANSSEMNNDLSTVAIAIVAASIVPF